MIFRVAVFLTRTFWTSVVLALSMRVILMKEKRRKIEKKNVLIDKTGWKQSLTWLLNTIMAPENWTNYKGWTSLERSCLVFPYFWQLFKNFMEFFLKFYKRLYLMECTDQGHILSTRVLPTWSLQILWDCKRAIFMCCLILNSSVVPQSIIKSNQNRLLCGLDLMT